MNQDKEKLTKAEQWWHSTTGSNYKDLGINQKDLITMYENQTEGVSP